MMTRQVTARLPQQRFTEIGFRLPFAATAYTVESRSSVR